MFFVTAHVNESEGWPSSRFRCECGYSLIWVATKHVLLTLTTPLTPVSHRKHLKDIQICIHAAADPERATQNSIFNHTSLFLCYRHLNNRSRPTGIKVYSLGINTYCLQLRSKRKYLKGVVDCFFSRLDCVYGVQSSMCSCLVFLKTHYFSHNLPLFHTSLSLL